MTEVHERRSETEGDIFDVSKVSEHIKKIEIFRLLLGLPKDAAEVKEHDPENDVDSTYQFSMVVSQICKELKYSEEDAVSILKDFGRKNYVSLSPHDDKIDESEIEKSIQNKDDYDKINLSFNTARILEVLLDDSIVLSEGLKKLIDLSERQEEFRSSYETQFTEIAKNYENIEKLQSDIDSAKTEFKTIKDTNIEELKTQADTLKAELNETVGPIAEKKAEEAAKNKVQDELKLGGDIGSAMQNMQKDIIQFMGIFVAIFALIGLSIGSSSSLSASDFFCVSLAITASMATLLFFISVIINAKRSRTIFTGIASVILWITAAVVHFGFPI